MKLIHAGIPFFNTTPFSLEIVEDGQQILGEYLLGFQAGNEPDLYVDHGHRPSVAHSQGSKKEELIRFVRVTRNMITLGKSERW